MGAGWAAAAPAPKVGEAAPGAERPARAPARRGLLRSSLRAGRWQQLQRGCGRRKRAPPRVAFCATVRVQEYSRELDGGDTVPGDGSKVSLGLGKPTRVSYAKLAEPRRAGQAPIEAKAWVPSRERQRVLRASMGEKRYLRAWLRHRREVVQMLCSRHETNKDGKDIVLMATSLQQARMQAQALSREVRSFAGTGAEGQRREAAQQPRGVTALPAPTNGGRKRRSPSPYVPSRTRRSTPEALEERSVPCHRCMLRIASGCPGQQCACLAQAAA